MKKIPRFHGTTGILPITKYANNVIILAITRLLVRGRTGLFEQKIDPQMVTSGNSNFAR